MEARVYMGIVARGVERLSSQSWCEWEAQRRAHRRTSSRDAPRQSNPGPGLRVSGAVASADTHVPQRVSEDPSRYRLRPPGHVQ